MKKTIYMFIVFCMSICLFNTIALADDWTWTQGTLSKELKYGDVNNDGAVSADDALELLNLITGTYSIKTMHYDSGDINKDGRISVRDGLMLVQNLAKIRDDKLGYENNLKDISYYVPESFKEGNEMLSSENPLAFYGADGYGKYTTGGRGGKIVYVTNLNDSGEGSLRAACQMDEKRIIVFRVSGTIFLSRDLDVKGNCTVAGETAPGDGITVANGSFRISGNNVIVRYITSRPGDQTGNQPDGIDVKGVYDVIVDHCSTSMGVDENLSISGGGLNGVCNRVTVQWCAINESITHSPNNGKRHGMGSIITSGHDGKISYHHNFLSSNSSRNPVVGSIDDSSTDPEGANYELANNLIYNWLGDNASKSSSNDENGKYLHISRFNVLNSYFKQGPESTGNSMFSEGANGSVSYVSGNMMDGIMPEDQQSMVTFTTDVAADPDTNIYYKVSGGYLTPEKYFSIGRFEDSLLTHLQTAEAAKDDIVKYVGNSLSRDTFDTAYVEDFVNGTGKLINQTFESAGWIYGKPEVNTGDKYYSWIVENYPKLASYPAYADTDEDGMSDDWEDFMGLDKNDATDGAASYKGSEYTNLDVFLQFLVENPDAAIAR